MLAADDPNHQERPFGELMLNLDIKLPIIAFAESPSTSNVVEAMLAGAFGYLEWPFNYQQLNVTLKRLSTEDDQRLRRAHARSQVKTLSHREKEVLSAAIGGMSNKQIGLALGISHRTVEIHRANIKSKLNAETIAEAVGIGIHAGLDNCRRTLGLPKVA